MDYLQIKNAIDTYNLKAQSFRSLFRDFDFQGFLKTSAQMNTLYSYHILAEYNPSAVPETRTLENYNMLSQFYASHMSACFSGRFQTDKLREMLDLYESIPEQYHELLTGWKPGKEEVSLCHKIIRENNFFQIYGRERFTEYKDAFLEAVLAKSLPNMGEEDIRGLIGTGLLDEEKFQGFRAKGLLADDTPLSLVYEALGVEQPVSIRVDAIKAVGTTFRTKSGAARQELLADLNALEEKEQLRLVTYIFQKQGHPDTNAVAVYWGEEDIANLSQTTVDSVFERMENPRFELTDYELIGGYSPNASYGIKVSFRATGMPKKENAEVPDTNRSMVVSNPMNI